MADESAAALVVHDLKNELGALESELDALAAALPDAAVQAAAARCHELRRRFVMYLAVYGGMPLRALAEDESPRGFAEAFVARRSSCGRGPKLRLACTGELPAWAWFDARLVTLALDAALHNARRFARAEIVLGLQAAPGRLVFTLDDDGPGLAAGGGDDPDAAQATGLGTALCRAVARAHGGDDGDVSLRDRPGGGARFRLAVAT